MFAVLLCALQNNKNPQVREQSNMHCVTDFFNAKNKAK